MSASRQDNAIRIWPTATLSEIDEDSQRWIPDISNKKKPAELVAMLGEAVERAPNDYSLRIWRAGLHADIGHRLEAAEEYREAIRIYPYDASTWETMESLVKLTPILPRASVGWRWTLEEPADNWMAADFDDSNWQTGSMPFGSYRKQTDWSSTDLWLRRELDLDRRLEKPIVFEAFVDDSAVVYLNAILASDAKYSSGKYLQFACSAEAIAGLKPGTNVLAIHAVNTFEGARIDIAIGTQRELLRLQRVRRI